jgi:hypothetical protein
MVLEGLSSLEGLRLAVQTVSYELDNLKDDGTCRNGAEVSVFGRLAVLGRHGSLSSTRGDCGQEN